VEQPTELPLEEPITEDPTPQEVTQPAEEASLEEVLPTNEPVD